VGLLVNGQVQALGHFEEELSVQIRYEAHGIGLSVDLQAMAQRNLHV
jgi:hypothetical protein